MSDPAPSTRPPGEGPAAEQHELAVLIRAGDGPIVVETRDEPAAVDLVGRVARELARPAFRWSAARGVSRIGYESGLDGNFPEPLDLLRHVDQRGDGALFALADFHPYLDDPVAVRLIREISRKSGRDAPTLVLISPRIEIPDSLKPQAVRFSLEPPSPAEIESLIRAEVAAAGRGRSRPTDPADGIVGRFVNHCAGLTRKDIRRLVRNAIHDDGRLDESDLAGLQRARFDLLDPARALRVEPDTARFSEVAGLPRLKGWLEKRAPVFRSAEPPPGLDAPRGILLLGVQGCGKSLAARATAGFFGVPLLQLDAGSLFDRFHGQSERNLREALRTADAMAPCVLWIDEIEKGLATGDQDGGTSKRMLATLLTWMAERASRVFLVATANDIQALPPELVRKGRFDEVFFVDLPDEETRAEILRIHLARRDRKPDLYDVAALARATPGFSGAELEHAVVSGLYAAFAEDRTLTNADIADAIRDTRPLSVMMAERIRELRDWASSRTVPA
ncbi:MAG: AAA family ATPase [Wenzhouxiangellaceae bacterium]|nr:AAA family ATPase [Wenzhouxiangellaceae bacterium]